VTTGTNAKNSSSASQIDRRVGHAAHRRRHRDGARDAQSAGERTAETLRGALMEGVLPGGGVALLNCRQALKRMLDGCNDPDERAAFRNPDASHGRADPHDYRQCGFDTGDVMAEVRLAGRATAST